MKLRGWPTTSAIAQAQYFVDDADVHVGQRGLLAARTSRRRLDLRDSRRSDLSKLIRSQFMKCRCASFTLTEMLTVVGVLAILTSMTMVAVSKAKSKAVSVQCQANLRQYGIALHNFLSTHGAFPLGMNPPGSRTTAEHGTMFFRSLRDEGLGPLPDRFPFKGPSVYLCPSAQRQTLPPSLSGELAMYGYNALGLEGHAAPPLGLGFMSVEEVLRPVSESEVRNPSQLIAVGDGVIGWKERFQDGTWILGRSSSATELAGSTGRVAKRHSGNLNVVFCDGHVETCTLNFLFSDDNDTALALWNRDHQPHRERLGQP